MFLKSSLGINFLIAGGVGPFIWELTRIFLFAAGKCLSQEYCFPEAGPTCRVMCIMVIYCMERDRRKGMWSLQVWKLQCAQECGSPQCLIRGGACLLAAVEGKRLIDQLE